MTTPRTAFSSINSATLRAAILAAAVGVLAGVPLSAQAPADPAAQAGTPSEAPELAEAKRLFDALEYEQALPLLDRAIALFEPDAARDAGARDRLIAALEMRARARFGLGNQEGAESDFRLLLTHDPGFTLDETVSPRVVAVLDGVKAATIGTIELALEPADAELVIDGLPRTYGSGRIPVTAGAHTIRASRTGFAPVEQPVTVLAGQSLPMRIALTRTSSVVTLISAPADTEVFVNGVSKGRTAPAADPSAFAEAAAQAGVPAGELGVLVLTDLATGTFDIEFRRDCHVADRRRLTLDTLADVLVDPVVLKRSIGTLVLDSEPTGADVLIDAEPRGTAPMTLADVCAGTHIVEFRTPVGRSVERVALDPGARLEIRGRVRPAFALVSGGPEGGDDLRVAVERALAPSDTVLLYAPPADVVADVIQGVALDEWFARDATPPADAREKIRTFSDALGAQGLAWVRPVRPGSRELRLGLIAPGSTEPDELILAPGQPESVKAVLERLRVPMTFTRGSAGLAVIDVLDVQGAVVAEVEPGSPAEAAGFEPGDLIVQLDGTPVSSALDFETRLASHAAGGQVSLGVRTRAGAEATRAVSLQRVPALAVTGDRQALANVGVAVLRARLAQTTDPALQPIVRLNLAAALLRAGDAAGARALLEQTILPRGPGVSAGTVKYLLGEAALQLGDQAAARTAWQAAREAGGRLSDDGPSVRLLAERALERLQ
ncbi:MAG TPA: PDZ domain-containing protein [Vicinamibacterales bacterium]